MSDSYEGGRVFGDLRIHAFRGTTAVCDAGSLLYASGAAFDATDGCEMCGHLLTREMVAAA